MSRSVSDGEEKLLNGIRVVDLTTFLSGPFGTQMLADLGAEVIKVEPLGGDSSRAIPPHFVEGDSAYYLANNRSKRSIAIDLKAPEGLEVARQLIDSADIVFENYRPGVAARLGLDPKEMIAKRESLVWVSISGFGQVGPWKDKPAYDMIVQALAGVMSLTGEEGRPAVRLGIPAGDLVAGMYGAYAALGAYIRRLRNGRGAHIDISMLDSQLVMTSYQAVYAMLSGVTPKPQGAGHDSIPTYRSFRGGDGREFVITANTERMWQGMCYVIDRASLIDDVRFVNAERRLEHREALWAILESAFTAKPAADWVRLLEEASVPAALIKTVSEALDDAKQHGRDMIVELEGDRGQTISVVGNPVRLLDAHGNESTWEAQEYRYPPRLGQDTELLMAELGLDAEKVADLVSREVLGAASVFEGHLR